jgi:3-hydroxyisobutyrate dehydrogenase
MSTAEQPVIAVLGLGAMGLPMAQHLALADFEVRGFDVDGQRSQLLERAGASSAGDPAAAAVGADVVLLAVRTLAQAEDCMFGAKGAAGCLTDRAVVILTSTVGVNGAVGLQERLAPQGVRLVDAPVSGGAVRAGNGELLVMASGDPVAMDAVDPVLRALASTLVVVGQRPGDGQAMKVVNQLLCGVHIAAAAEAMVLAESLGIEPLVALEVLGGGAAQSFMLGDRGPRIAAQLAGEPPEVRSRVDIFVKDLELVTDAATSNGLALPVAAAALELFRVGVEHGLGASDDSGVSLVVRAGT